MIFTDIIQLRDKLSDIAFDSNAFAVLAADSANSIGSGNLEMANMSFNATASDLQIKDENDNVIYTVNRGIIQDHLADVIPGTSLTLTDLFQTSSNTGDLYSTLSIITQKYSYSNRISLTDLNMMIDEINYQTGTNYDISSLKTQLLISSTNDGYVTNKSWLTCLDQWIKECKNEADNNSPDLDETKPSVLSGLYNIVTQALSSTLTAIFTAMGAIFGVLGALVAGAFAKIFSALVDYASASGSINVDATNTFAQGVCIARQETHSGATSSLEPYTADDYSINYINLDSSGFFFWKGDSNNQMKMNAYFSPSWGPTAASSKLMNLTSGVTISDISGQPTITRTGAYIRGDLIPYLTNEEAELISSDIGYYSACLCISEFMRWIYSMPKDTYDGSTRTAQKIKWTGFGSDLVLANVDNAFARAIIAGWALVSNYLAHSGDMWYDLPKSEIIDTANVLVHAGFEGRNNFTDVRVVFYNPSQSTTGLIDTHISFSCNPLVTTSYSNWEYNSAHNGVTMQWSYDDVNHSYGTGPFYGFFINFNDSPIKANSLPTEYCAKFNSITSAAILSVMIWTSVIATAAAVFSLKVSKAVRLKKIKKDILRTQNINQKKKAYEQALADPTKTPSEINQKLDEYVRSVDKFNRLGKLFHWGSYDAANSWVDRDTGGTSDPTKMSAIVDLFGNSRANLTDQMYGTAQQPSPLVQSLNSIQNSIDFTPILTKLDAILRLIK